MIYKKWRNVLGGRFKMLCSVSPVNVADLFIARTTQNTANIPTYFTFSNNSIVIMKKLYELIRVFVSFDGLNPTPVALLRLLYN